jgi:hypothetical protein
MNIIPPFFACGLLKYVLNFTAKSV